MVIGSICVPHITVADDTALITSSEDEMQGMVEDTESQLIRKGMLSIRPEEVLSYNNGTRSTCNHVGFDMGEKK